MENSTFPELIVQICAEGGGLAIRGRREGRNWSFQFETNSMLFHDEGGGIDRREGLSWDAAVARLEKYPWRKLHTHYVHPEFEQRLQELRLSGPPIDEI